MAYCREWNERIVMFLELLGPLEIKVYQNTKVLVHEPHPLQHQTSQNFEPTKE